jgi:hypothetical protein
MSESKQLLESWKTDFRATYDADERNAVKQSFDEYWNWISTFLVTGGAGQPGWLEQVDRALAKVGDRKVAARLRARFLALGKSIAADWAKQGRYRHIHSTILQGRPNLQDLGVRMQRAASKDAGDGSAIEDALLRIEEDVKAALEG